MITMISGQAGLLLVAAAAVIPAALVVFLWSKYRRAARSARAAAGRAVAAEAKLAALIQAEPALAAHEALLRRSRPELMTDVLSAGDIQLNRDTHRVERAGREVHLGPTEFRLLEFLMRTPGRVFSREQLLDGVWGRDVYVDERTVDVHVGRLRKAINRGRVKDPIRTVRGAGYAFDDRFAGR